MIHDFLSFEEAPTTHACMERDTICVSVTGTIYLFQNVGKYKNVSRMEWEKKKKEWSGSLELADVNYYTQDG